MSAWILQTDCDACGDSRCAYRMCGDEADQQCERFCDNTNGLDTMLDAYLECALWSTTDNSDESGGNPLDDTYDSSDVSDDAWLAALNDCSNFMEAEEEDLEKAFSKPGYGGPDQAGHDFWLTRNGHGAGFWDRGLGALGDRLSKATKLYGSVDLYVGDDGKIHGF